MSVLRFFQRSVENQPSELRAEMQHIGTWRFGDGEGDGNENVEKTIGLTIKTTSLHVQHTFFVHVFAFASRLRRLFSSSKCIWRMRRKLKLNERRRKFLSLSELGYGSQEFTSTGIQQRLTEKLDSNNRDEDWYERTRIKFLSDVFAAVVAQASLFHKLT